MRTTNAAETLPARHLPGEAGIWVLIGGDLVLFSLFFVLLLVYRWDDPALFASSRAQLSQGFGLLNTVLMLSSSWFVATAVRAARSQADPALPSRLFGVALVCGLAFIVVKYFEYSAKLAVGITPTTNTFFMFYYVYTGIHLVHIVIGSGILIALRQYSRTGNFTTNKMQHIESGASFWHLVDMLWIVLFALLYLVA